MGSTFRRRPSDCDHVDGDASWQLPPSRDPSHSDHRVLVVEPPPATNLLGGFRPRSIICVVAAARDAPQSYAAATSGPTEMNHRSHRPRAPRMTARVGELRADIDHTHAKHAKRNEQSSLSLVNEGVGAYRRQVRPHQWLRKKKFSNVLERHSQADRASGRAQF